MRTTSNSNYSDLNAKKAFLMLQRQDTKEVDFWIDKADKLKKITTLTVHHILEESNEMIKKVEGNDFVLTVDEDSLITELIPIREMKSSDGSVTCNGQKIKDLIHTYRNDICELSGTYKGAKDWIFKAPENDSDLDASLATANPDDTAYIKRVFLALTVPDELDIFENQTLLGACAVLTSLKLDVLNGESLVSSFMSYKVHAPAFSFNKIEPLTFARTSYINMGDSLDLRVIVAAYDSTEILKIRYGINADTLPENWKEVTGKIILPGDSPGEYKVKGQIGLKGRSGIEWENWSFRYEVGKPSESVILPE